jgi:hypothetical protein
MNREESKAKAWSDAVDEARIEAFRSGLAAAAILAYESARKWAAIIKGKEWDNTPCVYEYARQQEAEQLAGLILEAKEANP